MEAQFDIVLKNLQFIVFFKVMATPEDYVFHK